MKNVNPVVRVVLSHEARAAVMSAWTNSLNALVVFGWADLSAEQLAVLTLVLSSYATLFGYIAAKMNDAHQIRLPFDDDNDEHQG